MQWGKTDIVSNIHAMLINAEPFHEFKHDTGYENAFVCGVSDSEYL